MINVAPSFRRINHVSVTSYPGFSVERRPQQNAHGGSFPFRHVFNVVERRIYTQTAFLTHVHLIRQQEKTIENNKVNRLITCFRQDTNQCLLTVNIILNHLATTARSSKWTQVSHSRSWSDTLRNHTHQVLKVSGYL